MNRIYAEDLTSPRAGIVVRIRADRVFYTDPQLPPPGRAGRPRRHRDLASCAQPASWPEPDAQLIAKDSRYGTVTVTAWHDLHPKLASRGRWA